MTGAIATREDAIAEYVLRDALFSFGNVVLGPLYEWEPELFEQISSLADGSVSLYDDPRHGELLNDLFPTDADTETAEFYRAQAQGCRLTARVLRAIVYEADFLRREAERRLQVALENEAKAEAAGGGNA